ncbi:MAG: bifunctional phosphoribosylaminoimidazolecarboxamide formyltransferase/IMP cyclohydrolase [Rubrivivax sp.]|nr:bifunctional phosphoribosylaminoimidazolecarboxamide formyltransferase/IMP cyclohydrolase [Rubrivivax sp.]
MKTALISVSDKTGIVEFARDLASLGVRLLSTGGTARLLADAGLNVTEVAQVTGSPEMLDGRVKTLHPHIHGGLLARRDLPEHMAALQTHGIATIDLLIVNLYPFAKATARAGCTLEDAIENIDVGGPAMLRAAAKNWGDVAVVIEPADYAQVLAELRAGAVQRSTRFRLAKKVFAHTAAYDGMISNYLGALQPGAEDRADAVPVRDAYPAVFSLQLTKTQDLRYGENPHQSAAFYRDAQPVPGTLAGWAQLQGKALSYNNIADADAAWECVKSFDPAVPACVIVKHANPCGVAVGTSAVDAYLKALRADATSAYGGILALNRPLDAEVVAAINSNKQFVEVAIAPAFTPEARALLAAKQNLRLLEVPLVQVANSHANSVANSGANSGLNSGPNSGMNLLDFKRVGGGVLLQSQDSKNVAPTEVRVVSRLMPTAAQMEDLMFAWKVAKFVKSNAIVFCGGGMTLGVGAGQMSRIYSAQIAAIKAANAGLSLQGSAVASDAFFPFRDGLDVVIDAGAGCVIQPGGSLRDDEVIAAADERGIAMVFTGTRHFRH